MNDRTPKGWIAPRRPKNRPPSEGQDDFFPDTVPQQPSPEKNLFEVSDDREKAQGRPLIDQLIAETRLNSRKEDLQALLEFTVKMRHIAPFNAMLLHVQKPGLSYAATARDWRERFGCRPKAHARPLVVLRNFGPVDFVFDVLDVEPELQESVYAFPAAGDISSSWLNTTMSTLASAVDRDHSGSAWGLQGRPSTLNRRLG